LLFLAGIVKFLAKGGNQWQTQMTALAVAAFAGDKEMAAFLVELDTNDLERAGDGGTVEESELL
jgi:environmental stress-induced protein Ves